MIKYVSPMFYFDKDCIKIAHAQVEKIIQHNFFLGKEACLECVMCSFHSSHSGFSFAVSEKNGKEFVFYELTESAYVRKEMYAKNTPFSFCQISENAFNEMMDKNKKIALKCDEEIRNFDWKSIGVIGFEESTMVYCYEEKRYKDEKLC